MRKGLKLTTHSWAIWGPRERCRESMNSGRCRAKEILSVQSTIKLGSMSQSCSMAPQNTETIRIKAMSLGLRSSRTVSTSTCQTPVDLSAPDSTSR